MQRRLGTLIAVLVWGVLAIPSWASATEGEVKRILAERIDRHGQSVGIVVGIVDADDKTVVGYGKLSVEDPRVPDGQTVYEIGSISKVFTGIALASMAQDGTVQLDDPVAKWLPDSVSIPERGGKQITLKHLTTHRSGLPRMPSNFAPADPTNPFADYTVERLYSFLNGHELARDIGAEAEYSNLGTGLLGHVLALRAGSDYETLVRKRITKPLGMNDTSIALNKKQQARLARGHDATMSIVPNWDINDTVAGAGALRSTADDMLRFLEANLQSNLGLKKNKIAAALKTAQQPLEPFRGDALHIGMGWILQEGHGSTIAWHNGGTGGYRTFAGFDAEAQRGVVVLSNATNSIDDIGLHLLNSKYELTSFEEPDAVKVDDAVFDSYVGRYQLTPQFILTVSRKDDQYFVQATGQGPIEVFPESDVSYLARVVEAKVEFGKDADGNVTHLNLHQGGAVQKAVRMTGEAPVAPNKIDLDADALARFVGQYQLAPGFILTISQDGTQLMAQATGQQAFKISPSSQNEFFFEGIEAQLTFDIEAGKPATALTLHQGGRDIPGPRVE